MTTQHPTTFTPDARFLLGLFQLPHSLYGDTPRDWTVSFRPALPNRH